MLRKRILAAATATVLALGMSVGGAGAAFADHGGNNPVVPTPIAGVTLTDENGLTCDKAGYTKPGAMDASSGSYSSEWGSVSWNGSSFTWTLNSGWDVDFCVKGSSWLAEVDTSVFSGSTYNFQAQLGHGISHTGFKVISTPPTPTEVTPAATPTGVSCELNDGSITFSNVAGIASYSVAGVEGTFAPGSTLSGLTAGDYMVSAVAADTFVLAANSSPFTVTVPGVTENCEQPEPVVMNITYICKTAQDGPVLNTEYAGDATEWNEGDYIVRIRSNTADVPFQVKVGGTLVYEGVSINGDLFFALTEPTAGMTVFWEGGSKGTASTNESLCSYPEPEPVVMNITFICKTAQDGPVLNLAYVEDETSWEEGTYIVRVRSDKADVPFQVKVGGTLIYEGVSIAGDVFFALDEPTAGMTVFWEGGSKGTASTNESLCSYPIEPSIRAAVVATECDTDVPFILFDIALDDPENRYEGDGTVSLLFDDGTNSFTLVLGQLDENNELQGKMLWPGASITDGVADGWPGWQFTGGTWQNVGDDNFGWTRVLESATVSINPEVEVDINYPEATPDCVVDPVEVEADIAFSYDCFEGGSITLTGDEGVIWSLNGVPTEQRVWTGLPLDFAGEFTASLDPERPGLYFSASSVTDASVTFEEPFPCDLTTLPLVEPNVTTTQATCDASGSYTLSNTEGVQWFVNGQAANAGTYTAAPGSTVSVEAVALDGFGFGFETQTEWELEFAAAPTNCTDLDLPTLALTGASGMLGTLGIVALLITLTGIGVVATRRRVEV